MTDIIIAVQLFFGLIIGLYFLNLYKTQKSQKSSIEKESRMQMNKLQQMRSISLTMPLSEKTRPTAFEDIVGQEDGIRALKAAICGKNPQHVLIYGPPGVGKTCAARLVLEEAKRNPASPFTRNAKFIEVDATCVRFDERSIADPLIGSVHDPIYQGAGNMGAAGIPQPKPGAVTKAHGGILFLDEIGEIHPIQMNKLLKVLEDRKVMLDSAYYSREDTNIPAHIHEIFQNGLPADFRLVGATTRNPSDIPAAIRSRCLEIFFRPLYHDEICKIAQKSAEKAGFDIQKDALEVIGQYSSNGRDTVNMIQLAGGLAYEQKRDTILKEDIEWVVATGHYQKAPEVKLKKGGAVGCVNGLAVCGSGMGMVMPIEAIASKTGNGAGKVRLTGFVEEEEIGGNMNHMKRKSTAKCSIENMLTVLKTKMGLPVEDYDIHINVPGGMPVDGPSAGIAITAAVYSAITGQKINSQIAMTGEISITGKVMPVGGVQEKCEAAKKAGAKLIIIPKENETEHLKKLGVPLICASQIQEVFDALLLQTDQKLLVDTENLELLIASGAEKTA